jgi:hypothetical protein
METFPWATAAVDHTSPPQDEDTPAAKKPRLEMSISTAIDDIVDTHTSDTVTNDAPCNTVAAAARDKVAAPLLYVRASRASRDRRSWTPEEDAKLTEGVQQHGKDWVSVAALVPGRNNKDCKSRWDNNVGPSIGRKIGRWTPEEDAKLTDAVTKYGADFVAVAALIPDRAKEQCRRRWAVVGLTTIIEGKHASAGASTTSGGKIKAGSRFRRGWTLEEEDKLVSAVENCGACSWAEIATKVPGRSDRQCQSKWRNISKTTGGAATDTDTDTGAWTVEEEKKLVSMVETFGTSSWAKVVPNIPGRSYIQCTSKWQNMSRRAAATATGAWTIEEKKKLVSAVETLGTASWASIAVHVPGRSENQCRCKWQKKSRKPDTDSWTLDEEMKLVSSVETYGGSNWARIAVNVPGRNENQCRHKGQRISGQTADAENAAAKTDATGLSQLSGLEVGADLHVFPRESQQFLALLGITTAQSLLEINVEELAASYVGWRGETVTLDDARATVREWKSRLGMDPTEPAGIHKTATADGYTSGDEPPRKRGRFDWVRRIPGNVARALESQDSWW